MDIFLQSVNEILKQRNPNVFITKCLISINLIVFMLMVLGGAGIWHSPNNIQLDWGANFGPATQDGDWWRLASAMFLHFGVVHLLLNAWSLWDAGLMVERMYGHVRFLAVYLISGLAGNLVSLVFQGNSAISGGASGAIFGVFGALLTFLWRERAAIILHEFRWLFWGACGFAIATIVMGFIVPGIDNTAHIGGFIAGILVSIVLAQPYQAPNWPIKASVTAASIFFISIAALVINIPPPKYRWSDEVLIRKQISDFLYENQTINRSWLEVIHESKAGSKSPAELASQINLTISEPYEKSFEKLSKLPTNTNLPSSIQLEGIIDYITVRKNETTSLIESLNHDAEIEH